MTGVVEPSKLIDSIAASGGGTKGGGVIGPRLGGQGGLVDNESLPVGGGGDGDALGERGDMPDAAGGREGFGKLRIRCS